MRGKVQTREGRYRLLMLVDPESQLGQAGLQEGAALCIVCFDGIDDIGEGFAVRVSVEVDGSESASFRNGN